VVYSNHSNQVADTLGPILPAIMREIRLSASVLRLTFLSYASSNCVVLAIMRIYPAFAQIVRIAQLVHMRTYPACHHEVRSLSASALRLTPLPYALRLCLTPLARASCSPSSGPSNHSNQVADTLVRV
jgi:hypothetical protein